MNISSATTKEIKIYLNIYIKIKFLKNTFFRQKVIINKIKFTKITRI